MNIAILGWGSLIWDLEILEPHVEGDWQMATGPRLPMEFSRISPKRKMGLVVCLDPEAGVACETHVIRSARADIHAAVDDLAARERAPLARIGAWHNSGISQGRMPTVVGQVEKWCRAYGWAGAVWTDLEPNFHAYTERAFDVDAAVAYLKTLDGENLTEAVNYIDSAPAQTRTPLREALKDDVWWQRALQEQADNNRNT